jgi:propionyl-CoA carboxylase alpha chain
MDGARIHGLVTNRDLLVGILRSEAFLAGDTGTGFLDDHSPAELTAGGGSRDQVTIRVHAAVAALAAQAARRAAATVYPSLPSGWRNNPSQLQQVTLEVAPGPATVPVAYRFDRTGALDALESDGHPLPGSRLWGCAPDLVDLEVDGIRRRFEVHRVGATIYVDSPLGHTQLHEHPQDAGGLGADTPGPKVAARPPGSRPPRGPDLEPMVSPLPGVVRRVAVRAGERVEAGAVVVVVEAMKTEHRIAAPRAGTVGRVLVAEGQEVAAGATVIELEGIADG